MWHTLLCPALLCCPCLLPTHHPHPCRSGVVLVHQEPAEARKPSVRWRLYVFKNGEPFGEPLHIHRWALMWLTWLGG